jgi:hypothetical protein
MPKYSWGQMKQVYENQVGHPIMSAKIQLVSKVGMPHQNWPLKIKFVNNISYGVG